MNLNRALGGFRKEFLTAVLQFCCYHSLNFIRLISVSPTSYIFDFDFFSSISFGFPTGPGVDCWSHPRRCRRPNCLPKHWRRLRPLCCQSILEQTRANKMFHKHQFQLHGNCTEIALTFGWKFFEFIVLFQTTEMGFIFVGHDCEFIYSGVLVNGIIARVCSWTSENENAQFANVWNVSKLVSIEVSEWIEEVRHLSEFRSFRTKAFSNESTA